MRPANFLTLLSIMLLAGCANTLNNRNLEPYGIWAGKLPCADCPGIETRLALYKDPYIYRLEQNYLERDAEPVIYEGEWVLLPPIDNMDPGRISLKGEGEAPLKQLQRLPGGNLEMLDPQGQPIRSDLNYVLERKRISD